jgi:hypothetical protein
MQKGFCGSKKLEKPTDITHGSIFFSWKKKMYNQREQNREISRLDEGRWTLKSQNVGEFKVQCKSRELNG